MIQRLKNLSEREFLKWFFLYFSFSFLAAAFCMPDRAQMLPGLWRILSMPTKASTCFFDIGGFSATFLNMGLVALVCAGLYWIPGKKAAPASVLATILTTGFSAWGIHILNMWPTMFGVVLHCWIKRRKIGDHTNAMLFTTGLAPFISELMVRYPYTEVVGFRLSGILLTFVLGAFVGFFIPSGLESSPEHHKGFDLYSAALPIGMMAFFIQSFLYRAMGVPVPKSVSDLSVVSPVIVNTFCIVLFSSFVVIASLLGCRPRDYWKLLSNQEAVQNYSSTYGNATFLMNVGLYGLFILAYYNNVGAPFNAVTFGVIFCMLSTCNSGSHPGNVWTITIGYFLASRLMQLLAPLAHGEYNQFVNTQAMVVGLCFANGLSPIADKYGWIYGILASMLHFMMVTTVPDLHGGMCLYNGGFTAALVCFLMLPGLQRHVTPKLERRRARALAKEK